MRSLWTQRADCTDVTHPVLREGNAWQQGAGGCAGVGAVLGTSSHQSQAVLANREGVIRTEPGRAFLETPRTWEIRAEGL